MAMARMRTAAGVYDIIKAEDPGTEVTLTFIRQIIKTCKVPVTAVGRKKLVDADAVIAYIAAGTQTEPEPKQDSRFRRVPVSLGKGR